MKNVFRWLAAGVLVLALLLLPVQPCSAQCTVTLPTGVVAVDSASQAQNPDGRSWACAFPTIQQALAAVPANGQVWVAAGTYTPGTSAGDSFELVNGTWLLGGFAGTELVRTDADPDANPTILSGNLGSSTFATNVVSAIDTTASLTRLDGFTITNGVGGPGAGLQVVIDQTNGTVRLNVTRCKFVSNFAFSAQGGAVALLDNSGLAAPEIEVAFTNCKFLNNSAAAGGAVYFQQNANATFTNCVFAGNTASGDGGAIYVKRTCTNADDCDEAQCQAGFVNQANINSCTFWGNTADAAGGAVWLGHEEGLNVTGSIFWENATDAGGDTTEREQIAIEFDCASAKNVINYSCIEGLSTIGGTGNIGSDPLFVNGGAGHFQLRSSSPAIDAGAVGFAFPVDSLDFDYDMNTTELAPDLDRHLRIIGIEIDMGAYERLCGCEADTVTSAVSAAA